jgi:hypothetical protein
MAITSAYCKAVALERLFKCRDGAGTTSLKRVFVRAASIA